MKTPCDYGECPYDAYSGETCRVYCGLGVDVACDEDEEDRHIRSSVCGDYGSSNPWDAPGMNVKDFIR